MLSLHNNEIIAIEFLCENLSFNHNWFGNGLIQIMSLPNAKKVNINDAFRYFDPNTIFLINCMAEINQQ